MADVPEEVLDFTLDWLGFTFCCALDGCTEDLGFPGNVRELIETISWHLEEWH